MEAKKNLSQPSKKQGSKILLQPLKSKNSIEKQMVSFINNIKNKNKKMTTVQVRKCNLFIAAFFSCITISAQQTNADSNDKTSKNKALVMEMNRLFNAGKTAEATQYYSDSLTKKGKINGRSFFVAMQEDIERTFPNVQTKIIDIWADGDWVITNCLFSGTHKGIAHLPHHGGLLIDKEPSNKSFSVQHIRMYKIVNGKIIDRKAVRDDIGMYQQLGLLPKPLPIAPPKN